MTQQNQGSQPNPTTETTQLRYYTQRVGPSHAQNQDPIGPTAFTAVLCDLMERHPHIRKDAMAVLDKIEVRLVTGCCPTCGRK